MTIVVSRKARCVMADSFESVTALRAYLKDRAESIANTVTTNAKSLWENPMQHFAKSAKTYTDNFKSQVDAAYKGNPEELIGQFMPGGLGVAGTFVGAASKGWSKKTAATAMEMKNSGESLASIKEATGLDISPIYNKVPSVVREQQVLRKEINDEPMKWKMNVGEIKPVKEYKLGDVIDHEELFSAYPTLKNTKIGFSARAPSAGAYFPLDNTIVMREFGDSRTLVHEIQHAIQEREGWPRGSSKDQSFRYSKEQEEIQNRLMGYQGINRLDAQSIDQIISNEIYYRQAGEAESRAVERRLIEKDPTKLLKDSYDVDPAQLILNYISGRQ